MDHQTLERLLTDRAVRQLDDDSAALLANYLAEHPELQESAESIQETVRLAECAFQRPESLELPPLDRYRIERSRRSKLLGQVLAVAAAFVLGATTMLMMPPADRLTVDGPGRATPGSVPLVTYPLAQPIRSENFWSLKRISVADLVRNVERHPDQSRAIQHAIESAF